MKEVLIDLDNTLIETMTEEPTWESLKLLRLLKEENIEIVGFTSRPRFLKFFTHWILKRSGIKLDDLIMGKPRADAYIGNRAVNFDCRTGDADKTMTEIRRLLNV